MSNPTVIKFFPEYADKYVNKNLPVDADQEKIFDERYKQKFT